MHIEAATAVQFSEEEFMKALDRGIFPVLLLCILFPCFTYISKFLFGKTFFSEFFFSFFYIYIFFIVSHIRFKYIFIYI